MVIPQDCLAFGYCFSILFFGGLWGFVGMIIGVPFFAVVYDVITRLVMRGLRRNQRDDMLMAYDEQYVKKSKITAAAGKALVRGRRKAGDDTGKNKAKKNSQKVL